MILKISYLTYLIPFIGATIGMVSVYFLQLKKSIAFKLILAFSGAFILGITIHHLIPKVFSQNFFMAGPWGISGILFQILLEFVSQGVEHGHTHLKENSELPWLLLISLGIHSFFEGLPLSNQNELLWGIFIHKIPIGMVVFILIWETNTATVIKLFSLLLFAIMSPLGSIFNDYFTLNYKWQLQIISIVIGMLLHISTTILFESNQGHSFNIRKLLTIIFAFTLSYFL